MNKSLIAALAAAVVLTIGGVIYYFYFADVDDITLAQRAVHGSGSATCSFTDPQTGDDGLLYAQRGDIRFVADTTMELEDGEEQAVRINMMVKDDTVYQWAEGDPQGFQFSVDQSAELGADVDEIPLKGTEDDEQFEQEFAAFSFDCNRGVDSGALDLPEDVEFMDFSTLFQDEMFEQNGGAPEADEQFGDDFNNDF